jgi:DNA-binding SARP family transcriptional activator
MEIRLFGGVELLVRGSPVVLGPAKQRTLFAVLALSAPGVVPIESLVERIWDDRVPAHARDVVYSYVSRLRNLLPGCAAGVGIERGDGGYRLAVPNDALDLCRFRGLVDQARRLPAVRDAERVALLCRALDLCRGTPLAGLSGGWVVGVRDALERQRLAAVTDRIDAQLRLGRHLTVLDELAALVAANRLDERLVGQLMVALEYAGQHAAALHEYAQARAYIVETLGDEPGPVLRDLHTRLLRGQMPDPAGCLIGPQWTVRACGVECCQP